MLIDGIVLAEGSTISNMSVAIGLTFPGSPDAGELFFRTTDQLLYCYNGSSWKQVGGTTTLGSTVAELGGTYLSLAGLTSVTSSSFIGSLAGTATNASQLNGIAASLYAQTSTLAPVATSGSYDDLTNKPAPATANNDASLLTIGTLNAARLPALTWSMLSDKPTTIAGYSISDAYTKSLTDSKYVTKLSYLSAIQALTPGPFVGASGADLNIFTCQTTGVWRAAFSASFRSSGKFLFSGKSGNEYASYIGMAISGWSSGTIGDQFGSPSSFSVRTSDGLLKAGTGITLNGSGLFNSAYQTYTIAVDLDAGKAWVHNGTAWNNSGNPDTGVNPSFTWPAGSLSFGVVGQPNHDYGIITVNTGQTAFTGITNVTTFAAGFGPGGTDNYVTTFNGRNTNITLTGSDVATALGFTPVSNLTGDVTSVGNATTLSSAGTAGTKGSAASVPVFVTDTKGRVTSNVNTSIAIDATQVTSGTLANAQIAASNVTQHQAALSILETQITDGALLTRVAGNETVTGNWTFSNAVTGAAPILSTHLATKNYVDAAIAGLSWKQPVAYATTALITLSGLQNIDGESILAGQRILVKNQNSYSQNGIYLAAVGAWTRATDFDQVSPIDEVNSAAVFVSSGLTQRDTAWTQTSDVTAIGSSNITFVQFSSVGSNTAGNGLTLTGNTFALASTITGLTSVTANTFNGNLDGNATFASNANQLGGLSSTEYVRTNQAATVAFTGSYNDLTNKPTAGAAYDIASYFPGKPAANERIFSFAVVRGFTTGGPGLFHFAKCGVTGMNSSNFNIKRNGIQVGSMSFLSGMTTGTIWLATNFMPGDTLEIVQMGSIDTTLADITFTIAANLT